MWQEYQRRLRNISEITAIPQLLAMLELKGSIVTIDSMECQTDIARVIVEQEADYVLALKGNHAKGHEQVSDFFKVTQQHPYHALDATPYESCEKDHGRIESRWVVALSSKYPGQVGAWQSLKSIVMVESSRVGSRDWRKAHL